jgi:hypothetical protein
VFGLYPSERYHQGPKGARAGQRSLKDAAGMQLTRSGRTCGGAAGPLSPLATKADFQPWLMAKCVIVVALSISTAVTIPPMAPPTVSPLTLPRSMLIWRIQVFDTADRPKEWATDRAGTAVALDGALEQ